MRIFDNPNHPQYGPVRRLWIILVQLDLLEAAERFVARRSAKPGQWDYVISLQIAAGENESAVQREFLYDIIEGPNE